MKHGVICLSVLTLSGWWAVAPAGSALIPINNASFESPTVDPNAFPALPYAEQWTESDLDTQYSTNTGVFANTPAGSGDRMVNADGNQLAFLASQKGNAFEQDLAATYKVGCDYRLTVGVGISWRFPPATAEPADTLELVLYYRDGDKSVEIVHQSVKATGLSWTQLQDFSAYMPTVRSGDAWAGKTIGVAIRAAGAAGGFWDVDNVRLMELLPVPVAVKNASFELPAVDPNAFPALPYAEQWTEFDLDTLYGTNTGVFANTAVGSPDRMVNADGGQLAFLGSQKGNGFEQDLGAAYRAGCDYQLTVGVGVSSKFPPSSVEPVDKVELVLYYRDGEKPVDVISQAVKAEGLSSTRLQDFSVYLPAVRSADVWAGKTMGVAIRAAGAAGGFWDLDNVRLIELLPVSIPIVNGSFESPVVDPNGFGALPYADRWTEFDLDTLYSANTGVFANTAVGSPDRMVNADGSQLAFMGSQQGNALEQDLSATYETGRSYRLTVGVGVSSRFPPSVAEPVDALELVLYYRDGTKSVDAVRQKVLATGLSSTQLQDFSVYLPPVRPSDAWAGKTVGVAIRAAGAAGGFWDLDNVRLAASIKEQ